VVDISHLDLMFYDRDGDADKLREEIIRILRSDNPGRNALAYISDMFDPTSNTAYKIEKFNRRKEGNPQQRKQGEKTLHRLVAIRRQLKNPANFVGHAAMLTGHDPKTIRDYKSDVEKRIADEDANEADFRESVHQERLTLFKEICLDAPDEPTAAARAKRILGVPEEETLAILARAKAKRPASEGGPQYD
jgi:hypothetical protein